MLSRGDPIVMIGRDGMSVIRKIDAVSKKDGRIKVGYDWFTIGITDQYGRTLRALTTAEMEQWLLEQQKTILLRSIEDLPATKELVAALTSVHDSFEQ